MPEFILDMGDDVAAQRFSKLDEFTSGYVEAAFWLIDEELKGTATFADLAPDALAAMIADCENFQTSNREDLDEALDNGRINGYTARSAGVDFWLTRNHHGAGFWDRGLGSVGKKLTDMAHPYGGCDLYRGDDGRLYIT